MASPVGHVQALAVGQLVAQVRQRRQVSGLVRRHRDIRSAITCVDDEIPVQVTHVEELLDIVGCDLALFNYDGPDLDSGTVVEFMFAKFADIPSVLLRTDLRNNGDFADEPWNLMTSYFPRTATVIAER